ncbi:MAG: PEP/pyruvate-binding domain-containing protein [Verrucomicrobiae bacterium]|nr:PEP/pyruvate-binding domain-containing protein [Verrucomicrobiae bacterium]
MTTASHPAAAVPPDSHNRDLSFFSTGLPGLDRTLQNLQAGDNVVWQVETVDEYRPFVLPFWEECLRQRRPLVYFRFGRHAELISPGQGGKYLRLRPEDGFEKFVGEILDVIEAEGLGACYVFDMLSDLAADWYSDRMLGNFFRITCPFLYDLKTIAYFGLRKDHHSFHATDPIHNTAQVVLEVHRKRDQLYIHPQKVWQRHSPTMYMLHAWEGQEFKPVTNSAVITEILASVPQPWLDFSVHRLGVWVRTFRQAQATLKAVQQGRKSNAEAQAFFQRLVKMVLTREERFIALAQQYLSLADLIEVMQRMIGTGLIGGKSLGMLLARAVLRQKRPDLWQKLEGHDSFFIGSDVFYTYLVQNGCWWLRRRQKDFEVLLQNAELARQKILEGEFPDFITEQFEEMLEYFGQSPIIVRSSSLLEDNYGNAFSGKYESVFCANQGSPEERLQAFMQAVRTVYASTMSREGLEYRRHHGLLERDEQMALLVQRVSGEMFGTTYFPHLAGVGFSFNPFVWHEDIDPRAGVLRLVFGLGTRAVDRTEDDYTRLVALNVPLKQPDAKGGIARQFTQRRADLLDLAANQLTSREFRELAPQLPASLRDWLASEGQSGEGDWVLNFDPLLAQTPLATDLREMLRTLEEAYDYPVDVEFTVNFLPNGQYRINLLQCRPFQVKIRGEGSRVRIPGHIQPQDVVLESSGPIIGHSLATEVDQIIYVVPRVYSQMSMSQRYSVARTVGRLTHLHAERRPTIMIIGPGRWGTSMPSLGVPVSFAEINTVSVICELALMHEGLIPDISLGTHFFNDLVEMDMLYLAVTPGKEGYRFNEELLLAQTNRLAQLLPSAGALAEAIWVVEGGQNHAQFFLNVDSMSQKALAYREQKAD